MGIFSWLGGEKREEKSHWFRRLVIPAAGEDDPEVEAVKRAAAEDVAAMEAEDRKYFRQNGPGDREDDL